MAGRATCAGVVIALATLTGKLFLAVPALMSTRILALHDLKGNAARTVSHRVLKAFRDPTHTKVMSLARVFLRQVSSPFDALLIGAAVIALVLHQATDAAILFAIVCASALLGTRNEYRASEQSLRPPAYFPGFESVPLPMMGSIAVIVVYYAVAVEKL